MSIVFCILQQDYVLLAADSRHTRGDLQACYKSDRGVKTIEILKGRGALGFTGEDIGEQIVFPAKREQLLDDQPGLKEAADKLAEFGRTVYQTTSGGQQGVVEIMLAGFENDSRDGITAACYVLRSPGFVPCAVFFPYLCFEIIGRSRHGALYGLHRFVERNMDLDVALRVAVFVLREICEQDTTVGGQPHIYVIRRDSKKNQAEVRDLTPLVSWAEKAGKHLSVVMLTGLVPSIDSVSDTEMKSGG